MTVRISEYYDVFDVKYDTSLNNESLVNTENLPKGLIPTQETNTFSGFNNFPTTNPASSIQPYNAANSQYVEIAGKHKAPQVIANIDILENGDIICYPPNVSVPYWNKIIFRNFDYQCQPANDFKYKTVVDNYLNKITYFYPRYIANNPDYLTPDKSAGTINDTEYIIDYSEVPVFLKFDEYRSRSKVVFSQVDKHRNPDIEFNFGYHHGQMEPIKLNISLSCNNPIRNGQYQYNFNLNRTDIEKLLKKCYWSIEWVYERESGN